MTVKVTPRQFIAAVGVLLGVAAVIALMLPMSAEESGPFGGTITVDCGSAISTSVGAPSSACDDEVGTRRAWAVPMGVVGLAAVIGAFVVASPAGRRDDEAEDLDEAEPA